MQQFNTRSLTTGYIKQLLHDFNLPKIRVYTAAQARYAREHNGEERYDVLKSVSLDTEADAKNKVIYVPYLRENHIQEYTGIQWQNIAAGNNLHPHAHHYAYNQKILNYTKQLVIKNNLYDSYTHEYLGDYLRFHRDYEGINLMPLYNCFSNKLCPDLALTLEQGSTFQSSDTSYKIYMLPVKLFQKYTIAIDSDLPVEFCCGLYHHYQASQEGSTTALKILNNSTYHREASMRFSQPILFQKLDKSLKQILNEQQLAQIARLEGALKLFIKLPAKNNSTIVVLEGDYQAWTDRVVQNRTQAIRNNNISSQGFTTLNNHAIINLEPLFDLEQIDQFRDWDCPLISPLQLLQGNINKQVAFADRLLEYLLNNAITDRANELSGNIQKVQTLIKAHMNKIYDVLAKQQSQNGSLDNLTRYQPTELLWEPEFNKILYEYLNSAATIPSTKINIIDTLGYMDKDLEKYFEVQRVGSKLNMTTIEEDW